MDGEHVEPRNQASCAYVSCLRDGPLGLSCSIGSKMSGRTRAAIFSVVSYCNFYMYSIYIHMLVKPLRENIDFCASSSLSRLLKLCYFGIGRTQECGGGMFGPPKNELVDHESACKSQLSS